jgi:gamma-glutamylcyclotransferase (GGCT)/AIG2-like uncharacterized protein YtfP
MKKGDLLFVYGTLRQGESADLSLKSGAKLIGADTINGLIYNIGWFPGVHLPKNTDNGFDPRLPEVHGEVFEITDDAMVRQLDNYEGYPNLYDRSQVETSRSRFVWVYTYNGSPGDNQRIVSGDWLNPEATAIAAE